MKKPSNESICNAMRVIGEAIGRKNGDYDDAYTYGANFDCDEFMMHRFCWCDRQDCRWCMGCNCPESAYHYFVDDKRVTYKEWEQFFEREAGEAPFLKGKREWDAWERRADAANKRRSSRKYPVCEYCTVYNGKDEPNFHHKPTGLKVWWYKYIGRGMEVEGARGVNLSSVIMSCLQAVDKAEPGQGTKEDV